MMASATVQFSKPSANLFRFPPSNDPITLPAPLAGSTLSAPPFSIPPSTYNAALDVKVPIIIACVYASTVTALNAYNKSKGNKPWAISKTRIFFYFVVAHNIFLAIYSGWTFVGMWGALRRTVERWDGANGLAGTVDSLCKIHGPFGLANAVSYNSALPAWISESPTKVRLSDLGTPNSTDLGRLWNEGLAFYGWLFYLSKFYEVLDTVIILVKGKRSSTLQTYHHAGAMMCMWAGIRYMSPPIWMFVFVNSGIHAIMYTYYTLTAFSVPIPQPIKRSLTTMQIIQFLVGASYAAAHSFISYSIPVQVFSLVSASTESTASSAATPTSVGFGSLKKFLLRAVAELGLTENVANANTPQAQLSIRPDIPTYHMEYQNIPCIDTNGQTFAIWFNLLYLTPLTWLFVRFFIRSYLWRTGTSLKVKNGDKQEKSVIRVAEKATADALKGTEREAENGMNGNAMNGHKSARINGNGKKR